VEVLVNNDGVHHWTDLDDELFMQKLRMEYAINIEAPLHLSHLFIRLPQLKVIMNVTSGLAYVPYAKVPIYSASKAFLHSFTASMRRQLEERGIEVIEVIPPALNTDLGGLHDGHPPEFIESIFRQLDIVTHRKTLTFGISAELAVASAVELDNAFEKLNA
jgi:uncharacterized oxidoreductase